MLYSLQEFLDDGPITTNDLLDEDNMSSNSAVKAATQQSIKAYVDANTGTTNLSYTAGTRELASSTGTNVNLPEATTSNAGLQSSSDKTKLDGIEASATADQTNAEIRAAVEAASDSNVFTDADHTKLNAIESSATADQTGAEIKTAYEAESDTNAYTDAEKTKLSGIASSANNYSISSDLLDEDNMASNSATKAASQQSIKAYVDATAGTTNLSNTANGTSLTVESSTGTNTTLPAATTSAWGVMTDEDKTKLDGISAGANNYSISSDLLDEDNLGSDSSTKVPSQQSVKAYVDANAGGSDTNTTYGISCVDGDNTDEEKIRLTAGGSGSGTDDVVLEAGTGLSIARSGDKITFTNTVTDTNTQLTTEEVQDIIGAMVAGNTETNISVTYDDTNGKLDFVSTDTNTTYSVGDGGLTQNNFTNTLKTKLDGIEASADVTDATNVNSAGAVMNSDLDGKGELLVGDGSGDPAALAVGTDGYILKADSNEATGVKWAAAGAGGDTNQNAFSNFAVSGQDTVAADSTTDTVTLVGGTNVTITTNASSDEITFTSTDTNTQLTTEEVQDIIGAMVAGNTETNIVVTYDDTNGKLDFVSTDTNTTYSIQDGQLSQNNFTDADHTKLDGIETSADVTDATNVDAAGAVMNSDLDGKGEILIGDGSGDPTALAVGTNDYVLTADSNEATGVNWAAASGGGGSSVLVQDEGSALSTAATTLNFVGAGVAATGTGATKTITISGGGGTSDLIEIMMFT